MHSSRKKVLLAVIIMILVLISTGCTHANTVPKPVNGVLDLRNWNFAKNGTVALDGRWDFYWDEFLSYQDVQDKKPDLNAPVPETWNTYTIGQASLPGEGVATYRLRVETSLPQGTLLALRLKTVSSAYKLFINDKLLVGAGTVGTGIEAEKGEYNPQTAVFRVPDEQFDIIIQVSNFHYARGGLWDSLYLGDADQIHRYENILTGREAFLLGVLIIIALFYLAVFFLLRELRYTLYFSLLSLSAAVSVDTVGEFLLINSDFPFRAVIGIWYSATGWMTFFLVAFMHALFPSRFSGTAVKIYFGIMVVYQSIYIFLAPSYYTRYAFISNSSEILAIFVALIIILIGARRGDKNWLLNTISVIVFFIGYTHDVLYLTGNMGNQVREIFYWSGLAALALQMMTQAQRIKTYFDHKAYAELLLLQAQIKPHFLYNTINTIISVSRIDAEKARSLLIDFGQYLRRSFEIKGSNQLVALSDEIELAMAYIAIEKVRFANRLEVDFYIEEYIKEIKVPILILQPIIENAILHGVLPKRGGGKVEIDIHREGQWLSFTVRDNGVGIDKSNLETLLAQKGGSIGLFNINSRIQRLYKQGLEIKSEVNQGTEVKWYTLIK